MKMSKFELRLYNKYCGKSTENYYKYKFPNLVGTLPNTSLARSLVFCT